MAKERLRLGQLIVESVARAIWSDAEKATKKLRDEVNSLVAQNRNEQDQFTVQKLVDDVRRLENLRPADEQLERLVHHQANRAEAHTVKVVDDMTQEGTDVASIALSDAASRLARQRHNKKTG